MADKKYNIDDILRIFAKLEKKIEDLSCFVKECCTKIPVNIGTGIGLFKKFNQNKWEFKSLLPGNNINITQTNNEIIISSTTEPVDCQDIKDCIGINPSGDPDKYLNEQGNWQSISLTGNPTEVLYYDNLGNITSDSNFTRTPSLGESFFGSPNGFNDGGFVYLTSTEGRFGIRNGGSQDVYFWSNSANNGFNWNGTTFILPITPGNNGDVLTSDGNGTMIFQPIPSSPQFITAVSDTSSIDLTVTGTTLSADFINNAGYITLSSLSGGTGISYNNLTGVITNTAPDQTVVLTQGGTTTITGTYPNFTISSADQFTGTVTSVSALTLGTSGTDLSSTVANSTTTPVITLNVPTASATNRGVLSSTDWTTFNNKQAALGFTPEDVANKSTTTTLGTSNTLYPTQNAVKTYVDTELNLLTDKNQYIDVVDEFIGYNNALVSGTAGRVDTALHSVIKPAGVDLTKVSDTNKVCVLRCRTTSNTQINSYILSSGWNLGQGAFSMEFVHSISALATVAKDYVMVMGFANAITNAGITNGVYFLYNRSSYGATIQCVTISGGVSTVQAASNISASTWYNYKIEVNADGTSVNFYIDGVLQQTITTNIPTATTLNGFYGQQITSSSFNVAGFDLDYVWYKYNLTTPR